MESRINSLISTDFLKKKKRGKKKVVIVVIVILTQGPRRCGCVTAQDTTKKVHFHVNFSNGKQDAHISFGNVVRRKITMDESCLYFVLRFTSSSVTKKQLRHLSRHFFFAFYNKETLTTNRIVDSSAAYTL